MEKWHADATPPDGDALRRVAVQGAPRGLQRVGDRHARRTRAASRGRRTASTAARRCGAAYDAFGSERYVLAFDNKRLREIAAAGALRVHRDRRQRPHVRRRRHLQPVRDGRRGQRLHALRLRARVRPPLRRPGRRVLHLRRGLRLRRGERLEPWEPNVTADPKAAKWADLIPPGTALPTPWPKAEFEAIEKEIQAPASPAPRRAPARVGDGGAVPRGEPANRAALGRRPARPGGGSVRGRDATRRSGYYRPRADCIMFTRDAVGFCPVCRRAIERVIAQYAGR